MEESKSRALYSRFQKMQLILRDAIQYGEPITGIELLSSMDNTLAKIYQEQFCRSPDLDNPQSGQTRFYNIPDVDSEISASKLTGCEAISRSLTLERNLTINHALEIRKGRRDSPHNARQALEKFPRENILDEVLKGDFSDFDNSDRRCKKVVIDLLIKKAEKTQFDRQQKLNILRLLETAGAISLDFHLFQDVLTKEKVMKILRTSRQNLIKLVLPGNQNLFSFSFLDIAKICPNLKIIELFGFSSLPSGESTFNNLTILKIEECGEGTIEVDAPKLKFLSITNCSNLTSIKIGSIVLETVILENCNMITVDSLTLLRLNHNITHLTILNCGNICETYLLNLITQNRSLKELTMPNDIKGNLINILINNLTGKPEDVIKYIEFLFSENDCPELFSAALFNNITIIKKLVERQSFKHVLNIPDVQVEMIGCAIIMHLQAYFQNIFIEIMRTAEKCSAAEFIQILENNKKYLNTIIRMQNIAGLTLLHQVCYHQNYNIFLALKKEIHPEIFQHVLFMQSDNGNTVLHFAVLGGHADIVSHLLAHKKEMLLIKNKANKTALEIATQSSTNMKETFCRNLYWCIMSDKQEITANIKCNLIAFGNEPAEIITLLTEGGCGLSYGQPEKDTRTYKVDDLKYFHGVQVNIAITINSSLDNLQQHLSNNTSANIIIITFPLIIQNTFEDFQQNWAHRLNLTSNIPIILVGIGPERPNELKGANIISHQERSILTQNIGATKYIECTTGDRGHLRKIFEEVSRTLIFNFEAPSLDNSIVPIEKPINCIVVGATYSGKSSLISSYARSSFTNEHRPTVFEHIQYNANNGSGLTLSLYDIGGEPLQKQLEPRVDEQRIALVDLVKVDRVDVIIMVFSIVDPESYNFIEHNWGNIRKHWQNAKTILVGTKLDLRYDPKFLEDNGKRKTISYYEGLNFARANEAITYVECSAKSNMGIRQLFDSIITPPPANNLFQQQPRERDPNLPSCSRDEIVITMPILTKSQSLARARLRVGLFNIEDEQRMQAQHALCITLQDTGFGIGQSYSEGDCFFDSCAQALTAAKEKQYTFEVLRLLCSDYAKNLERVLPVATIDFNQENRIKNWIFRALKNDVQLYQKYLLQASFSAEETARLKDLYKIGDGYAIWGEQEIDGRIICQELNIQIHVIEIHEELLDHPDIASPTQHQIIDINGVHQVTESTQELYSDPNTIHIAIYRNHFVPILQRLPLEQIENQTQHFTPMYSSHRTFHQQSPLAPATPEPATRKGKEKVNSDDEDDILLNGYSP